MLTKEMAFILLMVFTSLLSVIHSVINTFDWTNDVFYKASKTGLINKKNIVNNKSFIRKVILYKEKTDSSLTYFRAIPVLVSEIVAIVFIILPIVDQIAVDFISPFGFLYIGIGNVVLHILYNVILMIIANILMKNPKYPKD